MKTLSWSLTHMCSSHACKQCVSVCMPILFALSLCLSISLDRSVQCLFVRASLFSLLTLCALIFIHCVAGWLTTKRARVSCREPCRHGSVGVEIRPLPGFGSSKRDADRNSSSFERCFSPRRKISKWMKERRGRGKTRGRQEGRHAGMPAGRQAGREIERERERDRGSETETESE